MMTVRYTEIDGEVIAEKRNGVRSLYVPDPLGSTVALLDNTQAQTDTFSYWPYGENNVRTGLTPTPFQFVGTGGYYRDSSTRVYVRARTLIPSVGRWLTVDPLTFDAGDLNLYRYVGNSPVSIGDSTGLLTPDFQCFIEAFAQLNPEGDSCKACKQARAKCNARIPCETETSFCNKSPINLPRLFGAAYGVYCGGDRDGLHFCMHGIDDLDKCCQEHDRCFHDKRLTAADVLKPSARGCNDRLCQCISQSQCKTPECERAKSTQLEWWCKKIKGLYKIPR